MSSGVELLETVLDGSDRLVLVCDAESFSVVYANKMARDYAKQGETPYKGVPCFKYMMGLDSQCPFCPLRKSEKRDSLNADVNLGDRVYNTKVEYKELDGRKVFVEYVADVTSIRRTEKQYVDQLKLLKDSIPNTDVVFHLDLTDNAVLGVDGEDGYIEGLKSWMASRQESTTVDSIVEILSCNIPKQVSRIAYLKDFACASLIRHYEEGKMSFEREMECFRDDEIIPYRACVRYMMNPINGHLEAVIYGVDLSQEKLAQERQLNFVTALSQDFRYVYLWNPDKDEISIVKQDGFMVRSDLGAENKFPYDAMWAHYIEDRVFSEDREMMYKAMEKEKVLAYLKDHENYVGTYRVVENGDIHYFQYKYVKIEGSSEIIAGFQNVDKLLDTEIFRNSIISTLAKVYFCAYDIDLSTGHFRELGDSTRDYISNVIGQMGESMEKFRAICQTTVAPEQVQEFLDFTNIHTLAGRLANRDSIGIHFKGLNAGWCEGLFVVISRDKNGRCSHVLWVVRSINEEVAREEAYKVQLKDALRKAERGSEAKSKFLARMSHDIRTPLNGIIGLLEVADRKEQSPEERAEGRRKAKNAANHLLSLLNDVLDMCEFDDAETQLLEEPFDLQQVLGEVRSIANLRADENDVVVRYDGALSEKCPHLLGSPLHVRQVFLNILTNAIKFNKKGGSVDCYSEIVNETSDVLTYCFHVVDSGIGMSKEFLERMFEPFTQERNDARSTYRGSGMGMAIVKALVEKMNGRVTVRSTEGVGTHVAVTIPFKIDQSSRVCLTEGAESESLDGMKVLLVEDNDLNLEIARRILEDMGVVVTSARDGEEAVRVFESAGQNELDLILMDLMMPVLDGFGATRKIRLSAKKEGAEIPIVALSANAFAEDVKKSRDAGMNGHLAKPIDIPLLKKTLNMYKRA